MVVYRAGWIKCRGNFSTEIKISGTDSEFLKFNIMKNLIWEVCWNVLFQRFQKSTFFKNKQTTTTKSHTHIDILSVSLYIERKSKQNTLVFCSLNQPILKRTHSKWKEIQYLVTLFQYELKLDFEILSTGNLWSSKRENHFLSFSDHNC